MTTRRRPADGGSATALVLGIVASVLVVLSAVALLGHAISTRGAAQTAADLAALAGAAAVVHGPASADPCLRAGVVARANQAELVSCARLAGGQLRVEVRVGAARATARAGPVGTSRTGSVLDSAPTPAFASHAL